MVSFYHFPLYNSSELLDWAVSVLNDLSLSSCSLKLDDEARFEVIKIVEAKLEFHTDPNRAKEVENIFQQ